MPRILPSLWFDTEAKEAAEFYCSVFPNSKITSTTYYDEAGPGKPGSVFLVDFTLDGHEYTALNGGPHDRFNDAISLVVDCADQAEIDYYWEKLTSGGGAEVQCGWCKDRYGVSWQVAPLGEMTKVLNDPDLERRKRATQAVYSMKKIDIAAIHAAAAGV